MPSFDFTSPDGKKYTVDGPEGSTQEQAFQILQGRIGKTTSKPEPDYSPTNGMSTFEKVAAGAGKAIVDTARGAGQWLGLEDRQGVQESRNRDAALSGTTAGKVGNFIGSAAMMIPAAAAGASLPAAAAVGAGFGMMQPSTSTQETALNTALGGAGGLGGQYVANKLPAVVNAYGQRGAAEAQKLTADNAQKFAAAAKGSALGYVVPPADLNPGVMIEALSGLSGKIKTGQVASQRNQTVTDKLAKQALGLAEDAPLDLAALNTIRSNAGQAYQAVSNAGTITPTAAYTQALDAIVAPFNKRLQGFPNAKPNPAIAEIESLRSPAFDSGSAIEKIRELRANADKAYVQGDKELGKALKGGADALEGAIDTHLVAAGAPADMLKNFRDARQLIAKTYTVQKALNPETGAVNAQRLAADLTKGRPLSGELKDAAQFGQAFPRASQMLKEAPKSVSPLDFAVAAASGAATSNPLMLATVAARPVARNILLSNLAQKSAINPVYSQSATSRLAPAAIDNELFKLLSMPVGTASGLGLAKLVQQK